MKTYSPLLILAMWLTALAISSIILYSCQKPEILPVRGGCMHQSTADTAAQN